MYRILSMIILVGILSACEIIEFESEKYEYSIVDQEGIIASIKKLDSAGEGHKGRYSILLIPDIKGIDISGKTEEELISLAQINDGSYYWVSPDIYDELSLEIGTKVKVFWGGGEAESNPPVRDAEKIVIISEK